METPQIFKVISCTPSTKGGFITKLQSSTPKQVMTPFGMKTQTSQTTYYIKLDNLVAVGMQAPLDVSIFDIVESPFEIQHPATPATATTPAVEAHSEEIILKWLRIK